MAVAAKELAMAAKAMTPGPLLLREVGHSKRGPKKKLSTPATAMFFFEEQIDLYISQISQLYVRIHKNYMQHLISSDRIEIIPSPDTCKLGVSVP